MVALYGRVCYVLPDRYLLILSDTKGIMSDISRRVFRVITPEIEGKIGAWRVQGLNGNQIHTKLDEDYRDRRKEDGSSVVSRQTVYDYLAWLREREDFEEWSEPWSLGSMGHPKWGKGVDWTDVPLILKVWQSLPLDVHSPVTGIFLYGPFSRVSRPPGITVLEAQWIAKLGRLAPDSDPHLLYMAAVKYSGLEWHQHAHGEPIDTAFYDIDIDLDTAEPFARLVVKARIVMFPREGDPDVDSINSLDHGELLDLLGPSTVYKDWAEFLAFLESSFPAPERSQEEES